LKIHGFAVFDAGNLDEGVEDWNFMTFERWQAIGVCNEEGARIKVE
jgi:hypothetical protein